MQIRFQDLYTPDQSLQLIPKKLVSRPQTAQVDEIGKVVKDLINEGYKVQVTFNIEPPPPQMQEYEEEETVTTKKFTYKAPLNRFRKS